MFFLFQRALLLFHLIVRFGYTCIKFVIPCTSSALILYRDWDVTQRIARVYNTTYICSVLVPVVTMKCPLVIMDSPLFSNLHQVNIRYMEMCMKILT